jgi:hypothetical protein
MLAGLVSKASESPVHAPLFDNEWTRETAAANMINHAILMRELRRVDDAILAFERAELLNPKRLYPGILAALRGQAAPPETEKTQTFESSLEDMLGA